MRDIRFIQKTYYYDIDFFNGDLIQTYGLDTAVEMSLFTDVRATSSEVPQIELRRGWWGNIVGDYPDYQIGSKLWLLDQSRLDQNTLNLIKTYSYNCLSWMIDDGYITNIDIIVTATGDFTAILNVKLSISQNVVFNNSFQIWARSINGNTISGK